MLKYRDRATLLNWTMTAWTSWATSTTKQNRIYQFFGKKLYQRRLQFLFAYCFSNWLAVSCFFFWKAFVKCPSVPVNGIFDDVRYLDDSCKNYENVFKFVKVMPRKLVASFFPGHGVGLHRPVGSHQASTCSAVHIGSHTHASRLHRCAWTQLDADCWHTERTTVDRTSQIR